MTFGRKKGVIIFLISLLLINLVVAQTIVQVPKEQPQKSSLLSFDFLKSQLFLGIVVFLIIIIVIAVILFFVIRAVIKFIKLRSDTFYRIRSERMAMAKVHRTYPSKHWWKIEKNTPIRLVKKNDQGELVVTRPIAYHRGDYLTSEGNVTVSMNFVGRKTWLIFPKKDLLVIPNKLSIPAGQTAKKYYQQNNFDKLPLAKDIIKFHEDEILLYAESLCNTGMFYIPVLKDSNGKIIDLSMPVYENLKAVALGDYLYDQTSEFSQLAKKSMDINPYVRATQKVADVNQQVEVPSGDQQGR